MELALRLLCRIYPDVSYGSLFRLWFEDNHSTPYASWGSGAIVRMAYAVDFVGDYRKRLDAIVDDVTLCTHNSHEALFAGALAAELAWMGLHGYDIVEIGERFYHYYPEQRGLKLAKDFKDYYPRRDAENNLKMAVQCFLESKNYSSAIKNCMPIYCDIPAVAAITGMIAGAYYQDFPETGLKSLSTYLGDYLMELYNENYEADLEEYLCAN